MTVTGARTRTLDVPGARLTYDVRSGGSDREPVLFLIGSPMGAGGFGTLAGHFADRTVMTWIVIAAGAESEGEMANRRGHAVAERLGTEPVTFPSDHGGFAGGEYGQTGDPDAFAAKLRQILEED